MSDELEGLAASREDEQTWSIQIQVTPTFDGRFARTNIRIDKPTSRVSTYVNSASSTDLLYEKLQGEVNNALRQIVNEIHQVVVKPNKHLRR